jgi:hypothetical protein
MQIQNLGRQLAVSGAEFEHARVGDVCHHIQCRAGMLLVLAGAGADSIQRRDHRLLDLVGDVVAVGVLQRIGLQPPIQPRGVWTAARHLCNDRIHRHRLTHRHQLPARRCLKQHLTERTSSFGI